MATSRISAQNLSAAEHSAQLRRAVVASTVGTVIEAYDFLLYVLVAPLVFAKLFFPSSDPLVGTLQAFGIYAVGFIARPVGAAFFGHYGDRIGRKVTLIATLLLTGLSTFAVGFVPSYASIGIWGAIILTTVRFIQGIGIGGEWGGATLIAMEWAKTNAHRGFITSWPQWGAPAGLFIANIMVLVFSAISGDQFLNWGWRVPFVLSVLLVGVGLFVRMRLSETPAFQRMRLAETVSRRPVLEVFSRVPRSVLIAIGMKISEVAWVYVLTVFTIVYATTKLGLPRSLILNGIIAGALLELITLPLAGALSDRFGRKPIYLTGVVLSIVCAFPVFWLLDTRDPVYVIAGLALVMNVTHAIGFGIGASWMPELFGTRVRYTGASLGCQVSAAISGGFSPIVATALLAWTGATWPVSLYMIALGLVAAWAVIAARETHAEELDGT